MISRLCWLKKHCRKSESNTLFFRFLTVSCGSLSRAGTCLSFCCLSLGGSRELCVSIAFQGPRFEMRLQGIQQTWFHLLLFYHVCVWISSYCRISQFTPKELSIFSIRVRSVRIQLQICFFHFAFLPRAAWGHGPTYAEQASSTISCFVGLQGDLRLISELWKCHTLEDHKEHRLVLGLFVRQLGLCDFRSKVLNLA